MSLQNNLTDQRLNELRQLGDQQADYVIKSIIKTHGADAAKTFFNQLIRNIEMPLDLHTEALDDFLKETASIDKWVTNSTLNESYKLFADHGPKMLIILYFKSLPLLYTNQKGSRVLVNTGRLAHKAETMEVFSRRIAETGQFLLDVLSKDGLEPGGDGIRAIQKIRLIHASVRHFVSGAHWDKEENGVPINQEDLALTLLTFSIVILDGLEQLQMTIPQQQEEAFLQRWFGIGKLLGIKPELIPSNREEAAWLLNEILARQARESNEGKTLTKALIHFSEETIPGTFLDITPKALIQFFVGADYAKMLGAFTWWFALARYIPTFLQKIFNFGERLEGKDERIAWVADKLSLVIANAMVGFFNTYKNRKFEIKPELMKAWGLDE
jgi:hypothetical protein